VMSPVLRREGWRRRTDPVHGTVTRGLDFAFCERARKQGFKVYAHYDYCCEHYKELELTEVFRAFEQWKAAVDEEQALRKEALTVRSPITTDGPPRIGVIFPVFALDEDAFQRQRTCFEKLRERFEGEIYVPDDGAFSESMKQFFAQAPCKYMPLQPHGGLTRSWNLAAQRAFHSGCDVVILGNSDAYPDTAEDLESLARSCRDNASRFFAVGPLTNKPGHCLTQGASGRNGKGIAPSHFINGFTWAIHKSNYERAVRERTHFLNESPKHRFVWLQTESGKVIGGQIREWEGSLMESLAMVGQEDELFFWNWHNHKDRPCAIDHGSFWRHNKVSAYLDAEVRQKLEEMACTTP
jgi:hypothetical protein